MAETLPDSFRDDGGGTGLAEAMREVIFGAEDGLVSILALVTGVAAGAADVDVALLAGVVGAFSGAVSMAAGNYLGVKSHIDVLKKKLREEARSIRERPHHEHQEIVDFFKHRGLTPEEIDVIVPAIERNKQFMMEVMATQELGISSDELRNPIWKALWIFAAYILASAFPVLPYAFFSLPVAMIISIGGTVLALFGVGAARTFYTGLNWARSGLEMLAVAALAGTVGYLAGLLAPIPGH